LKLDKSKMVSNMETVKIYTHIPGKNMHVVGEDGEEIILPTSNPIRVKMKKRLHGEIHGVKIVRDEVMDIFGLEENEPQEGVLHVVTYFVAQAVTKLGLARKDLLITGETWEINSTTIGCEHLVVGHKLDNKYFDSANKWKIGGHPCPHCNAIDWDYDDPDCSYHRDSLKVGDKQYLESFEMRRDEK